MNPPKIQFSRPSFGAEEAQAAADAVASGWVVGGPRLKTFEERVAAYCGAKEAVGVSSWTTGASLVLHAWGIGRGDEVIVSNFDMVTGPDKVNSGHDYPYTLSVIKRICPVNP